MSYILYVISYHKKKQQQRKPVLVCTFQKPMVFVKFKKKNWYHVLDEFIIICHYQNRKTFEPNFFFCFKPNHLGYDQTLYLCFWFNKKRMKLTMILLITITLKTCSWSSLFQYQKCMVYIVILHIDKVQEYMSQRPCILVFYPRVTTYQLGNLTLSFKLFISRLSS